MKQKAEITFEVEETVVLKQSAKVVTGYCPQCLRSVEMVSPDLLALVAGISEREIFRLIERGEVYFAEVERLTVCPNCYHRSVTKGATQLNDQVRELSN